MDTQVEVGKWNRVRCPARVRPTCSVCHQAIGAGQVMQDKPFAEVRHNRCHQTVVSTEAARPRTRRYR